MLDNCGGRASSHSLISTKARIKQQLHMLEQKPAPPLPPTQMEIWTVSQTWQDMRLSLCH